MESLYQGLIALKTPHSLAIILAFVGLTLGLITAAFLADRLTKKILQKILLPLIERSRNSWDDMALKHQLFNRLAPYASALLLYLGAGLFAVDNQAWTQSLTESLKRLGILYMIWVTIRVANAFLNALVDIYGSMTVGQHKPVRSYAQVVKIILFVVALILGMSALLGKSPWYFLTGLGAMTAIILLIFKDSILGLVASVQVNAYDMIRLGDWIEMPRYGVDGEVVDLSLNTVKVQNWDKTMVMVPTHALLDQSVKNWRGMSDSGGRRIKRCLYLDMKSVQFLDENSLAELSKIDLLKDYLQNKTTEIKQHNQAQQAGDQSPVNGRRLTNLGSFRAYVEAYLKNHPKVHQGMTLLVRHLQPTELGLPLEIYLFSNDQNWGRYEGIQADIFDHLLAILPNFGLQVFQRPNGQHLQVSLNPDSSIAESGLKQTSP